MKNVLILAAQEEELSGFFGPVQEGEKKDDRRIVKGDLSVRGLITGIGKTAMGFCLGKALSEEKPDLVVNIGVAGSISPKLSLLDTLVATSVSYWDVDITAFGHPMGQMSGCPTYFLPEKEVASFLKQNKDPSIKGGLILSGDSFISKENIHPEWFDQFEDPVSCDMESASVAQCCFLAGIPFVIIRSISDDTRKDSNFSVYEKNLVPMAKKAGDIAEKFLKMKFKE